MYEIKQTVGGNLEVSDPGRNWQVVILTWSVKKSDACYTLTSLVQSGHAIRGSGWWDKLEGDRRLPVLKTFYGLDLHVAQVDQDPGRDQEELSCTEKTWLACPCSQQKTGLHENRPYTLNTDREMEINFIHFYGNLTSSQLYLDWRQSSLNDADGKMHSTYFRNSIKISSAV